MYSFTERTKIAYKWLLSFLHSDWQLNHYPVRIRSNGNNPAPEYAWAAQILNWPGPTGLGATPKEAQQKLEESLESIRKNRSSMPRPGTHVPIQFASQTRVNANQLLLDDFIEKILGFKPNDPVFISDLSSLHDFADEENVDIYRKKILEIYGVDISDLKSALICDILERVDKEK
jgi:hypothetical protein